jgi:hypothetical protein
VVLSTGSITLSRQPALCWKHAYIGEETNLAVLLAGGAKACEHASTAAADTAISLEAATILQDCVHVVVEALPGR